MGDDSLIIREDGFLRIPFPVASLTYHTNLNVILLKTTSGVCHVLDVNSGVILQSSSLAADGIDYVPGADRLFLWNQHGVCARTDYNGVLLLNTALQLPLTTAQSDSVIQIELVLSEAVLLYQCLQSLNPLTIDGLSDFIKELNNAIDREPARRGVKAQKWSTATIQLPQSTLRSVMATVVQELKGQNRRIPALAIASAVGQCANELVIGSRDEDARALMYSEADRKQTFKRWPHMDYKWALPARMAQAGFYHQPSPSGDDRAMCFTCMVCLVCWEKSDEPWVEHERHSPNCPFVRGEYTHNVPISVTNATACATPCPNVTIVSKGNASDLVASGTSDGNVNIWKFDCGLKLIKFIHMSPYDSIFIGILSTDCNKVWSESLEKDSYTYDLELTAMAFVGMTDQLEPYPHHNTDTNEKESASNKTKPSLICAVTITRTRTAQTDQPIKEDDAYGKALFDSGLTDKSKESIKAMNDQNEAKSNMSPSNKLLFLLTYDILSSMSSSMTTVVHTSNSSGNSKAGGSKKVCAVARSDDANIYNEIYLQYSDDETELPQCTNNILEEQISHVINLNASSSKDDNKGWQPKNIIVTKHFKVMPPPPPTALLPELPDPGQVNVLDFVGKISQIKSWKSGNLEIGTKLADQTDSVLQQADPITHYLNMNGPLEISDLKWHEVWGENNDKVKITTFGGSKVASQGPISNSNNDGFDSDPPQEEAITQGVAIQCLAFPANLSLRDDSKVTHLIPTEDKEHLLVVISSISPDKLKNENENPNKMDLDETITEPDKIIDDSKQAEAHASDAKAYYLLYKINSKSSVSTLEDNPVSFKEVHYGESAVDLCLLPRGKHEEYSFAVTGADGCLRMYSLPDFKIISERTAPEGKFTSVVYCSSVERLSVCTTQGMMYFYALNNSEKDPTTDVDEDEFANIDYNLLQSAPRSEDNSGAAVILANKPSLDMKDLETLISLTGSYGTNTTVPYSAVVPGFWCELSPAQRSRSDHQNNRTWRLQNTSSTWDEHVLELTLPYSVSLAHIEFGFTLHIPCSVNLPKIQVTLLKQNVHGIGYNKEASFYGQRSTSPQRARSTDKAAPSNVENQVNSEEYLQAHNAEILAGPLLLSSGLDLSQQSGTLILTSPRLYRAKGRTFLIHIKTLFDPAKDMNKGSIKSGESSSKKTGFIGCDWLHQISITVRSSPHTSVPFERHQRIAMLESNGFLNKLFEIAISKNSSLKRKSALDLLIWVISIRLQRLRLTKCEKSKEGNRDCTNSVEPQQLECVKIIEKYADDLIKTCLLCSKRSIAKKCIKILLITREGVKQLSKPWRSNFDFTLSTCIGNSIPLLGACDSPGAMRWLTALVMHVTEPYSATNVTTLCLNLLERLSRCIQERSNSYHALLKARFGLYGLPFERMIFEVEGPVLGKSTATPVTYASVLSGDTTTTTSASSAPKPDYQLKDLYNLTGDTDGKTSSSQAWWNQNNSVGVFSAGLCESMPLHVTCHVASDGTKLEASGGRHPLAVVSSLPGDPAQLWTAVKEGQMKQSSQDPDSLEDAENSSLMDCDPQEKLDLPEEKLFKDQCGIPWAQLVMRPPQHTLLVERMHSGARRYIVLDFGHPVRLTDVIIPSCSDLVTLCIDIWLRGEDIDSVKLAFASDIATNSLVLSDIQPPPLCRYMKITTIGRYGMSAMKCKIPLGWFYGEIAEIANVQASINALNALHQDLACRFRLATGKLMDLLNPYLELYNGNAAHMMAYLNMPNDPDPKVMAAYQECMELQQQLHTATNMLRKLQNKTDCSDQVLDMVKKGKGTPDSLLERASTDKLRVMTENVVDMLIYFFFQMPEAVSQEVSVEWCRTVTPLLWECTPRAAAALATLLARLCGSASWWGGHLADTLQNAFSPVDVPPLALDRCLVLVMYMCRKSLVAHTQPNGGVAEALAARALALLRSTRPEPTLAAAVLSTLAAALDSASCPSKYKRNRWDWVTGGRPGGGMGTCGSGESGDQSSPRGSECKLHRRKLHKKLLHQMQELEGRRVVQVLTDEHQRARFKLKARMAMLGKRGYASGSASKPEPEPSAADVRARRLVSIPLAKDLAQALVAYILAADSAVGGDTIVLAAKVVGRLCSGSGGAGLLDPSCILGLARLVTTLPPWPRHALTVLLQDLVEFDNGETVTAGEDADEWEVPAPSLPSTAPINFQEDYTMYEKLTRKALIATEALANSFVIEKNNSFIKPEIVAITSEALKVIEDSPDLIQLPLVAESDDSDEDRLEQYFLQTLRKDSSRPKPSPDTSSSKNISSCVDARLDSSTEARSEAAARRLLLTGSGALAAAIKALPVAAPRSPDESPPARAHPPLAQTLYDVFRHLSLEFPYQTDCTFMENVIMLWLTLNGSVWGVTGFSTWSIYSVPSDGPKIRLAADAVNAMLASLVQLEHVTLRCWVLAFQALAWLANFPLQNEGSTQTMCRVILESEHLVPAIIKFVTMDVTNDGAVTTSEPYLSGVGVGAGVGAASVFHVMLSRVVCGRGAGSALVALRCVAAAWRRPAGPGVAYDLHAVLLRVANSQAQMLNDRHVYHALELVNTVATLSTSWVNESKESRSEACPEPRACGLLADVLAGGGGASAGRRTPLRRYVLAQLVQYTRRLLALQLRPHGHAAQSSASPSRSTSSEESQTDESKATQQQQQQQTTNIDDERKQQAARSPCLADTVLQNQDIMHRFYRTLSHCDNVNALVLNSGINTETTPEATSLKDEVFWLVAYMADLASHPSLVVDSLLDYIRKEENANLSQAMQQYIIRVLDKPEALCLFIEAGGLELAMDNLTACHHAQPNTSQGLVSSLMNYLKLPPQMRNMSTPASSSNKKSQPTVIESSNGLFNFAPLCTVICYNSTAQSADVLLGGHSSTNGSSACAARRVRAAAWSYHFFNGDDSSLPLLLNLPYAIQLHEVQLQPHLTSLATCPGAVAVEAGCGSTLAPLGPPHNTAGMTFIRLVLTRPFVCTSVQIRLYKPRDSTNMGLLQLKLLGAPAFNKIPPTPNNFMNGNNWASVVSACTRAPLAPDRWARLASGGALAALTALLSSGRGPGAAHAHHALLAAARAAPALRATLLDALLHADAAAHANAYQHASTGPCNNSMNAICELVRQICTSGSEGATQAYLAWLAVGAERWLRARTPLSAALVQTLSSVLWILKDERLMDNLEELITDDLFELIYTWVKDVPETSLLKKALDAVLCAMCYIRPELFKMLLEQMDIPLEGDMLNESMEAQTDDSKVSSAPASSMAPTPPPAPERTVNSVLKLRGWQLATVAAAAMSPAPTLALLHSKLPSAVVDAITDFSVNKLQSIKEYAGVPGDAQMTDLDEPRTRTGTGEIASMKCVCELVEWLRSLCADRRLKNWLGEAGSRFWYPLLQLLCYPRPAESTWQEGSQYAQLEENTTRLFAELTTCHVQNQKLFATTLYSILESLHSTGPEGISGFTRSLILRLLLSSECASVALRWGGPVGGAAAPGRHPAAYSHSLLALPTRTTVRALLRDHRPPLPLLDEVGKAGGSGLSVSGGPSVMRSASDTAIKSIADTYELSFAAATASKDKRIKDVKNTNLKQQNSKKRQTKTTNDVAVQSAADEMIESTIRVQVGGIEGYVSPGVTLAQLSAAVPHVFGPHLTLVLHLASKAEPSGTTWEGGGTEQPDAVGAAVLREFGACGGLALMAARLPRPHATAAQPPTHHAPLHDLDWVKLDDQFEEVVELGVPGAVADDSNGACGGVPPHTLLALGLLLKLPGYAEALLDEGARAVHLLRLLLGVTCDEEGRSIVVGGNGAGSWSLGTLPFRVVARLLESAPRGTDDGRLLRSLLLSVGAVRLVLACLAVFTHHKPTSAENSQASNGSSLGKAEDKSQLYWAKGTGFGTGSTQQSWNVEQALVRQKTEEEHVTVLMHVLASYMYPGEKWPPEEMTQEQEAEEERAMEVEPDSHDLPIEFISLVANSSLVPAISSYLRNDSVLDMSRHIPLYVCVLRCARALHSLRCRRLAPSLRSLPRLLRQMSRTTNSYATKLKMSRKNIFGKMTYSQRFSTSSNSELSEEDEGLASLIADIQATSALMCRSECDDEALACSLPRPLSGATREARYIEVMRRLQFETFEMMEECGENGYRFTVPYHFESAVRSAGERSHPARMKRLAQEAATLATSLPLSYSSSVFVRTDTDRLDVMKVLITGPSDTPYANGCFVLDVYFPAEYPAAPMLINLETTGRHSVRFNPNLYNDGKVCLSVLNTWHGRPEEKWNAHTSSFLQVLVSIQSLILVPEPYFNEPGYERSRGTRVGNNASLEYNSNIYQACVRWAMLDHLRNPSSCFKEVIQAHFWMKRNEIMQTISNWITELEGQSGDERTQRSIQLNLMALKRHYIKIQEELVKLPVPIGLEDLDEPFQLPLPGAPAAPPPPPPPAAPAPTTATSTPGDDIDHDLEKIVAHVLE